MYMKLYCFFSFLVMPATSLFTNNYGFHQVARRLRKNDALDKKKYMIDIDGTICSITESDYPNCKPQWDVIERCNALYAEGHEIHYWTARGAVSGKNWDDFTVNQLESWNVCYDTISMGKPHYDVWIDDKALHVSDFLNNNSIKPISIDSHRTSMKKEG